MTDEGHDHGACVKTALAKAESLCAEQNLRFTPLRRAVLERIWSGHEPVGAYQVLEDLAIEGRRVAPPTVYRALDFLMDAGLVHRLDSLNAYVGCIDPARQHDGQFLICRHCRNVTELDVNALGEQVAAAAAAEGFFAERQTLEVQGVCERCRESADP